MSQTLRHCGLLGVAVCAAGVGCGDPTPPPIVPVPSTSLTVLLESPSPLEGAGIIAIGAPGIDSVTSWDDSLVFSSLIGNRLHVIVIRRVPGAITFRAWVRDETIDLSPVLVQVADPDNQLRGDLRNYRVRVVP